MVQVTLPFGYPLVSGESFQTLIYQGTVVRLYTLPKDPRTEQQLFERRFLSDMTKVRSTLGDWGRGALKAALGSRWASVLYQLVKADDGERWSDAVGLWNDAFEADREGWRSVAPYTATFNDPGKVFFCLARVIAQVLYDFTGIYWDASLWTVDSYSDVLEWWEQDKSALILKGDAWYSTPGVWEVGSWFNSPQGRACYSVPGVKTWFYYWGIGVKIHADPLAGHADFDVVHDGGIVATVDPGTTPLMWVFNRDFKGMHYFAIQHHPGETSNHAITYQKFEVYG